MAVEAPKDINPRILALFASSNPDFDAMDREEDPSCDLVPRVHIRALSRVHFFVQDGYSCYIQLNIKGQMHLTKAKRVDIPLPEEVQGSIMIISGQQSMPTFRVTESTYLEKMETNSGDNSLASSNLNIVAFGTNRWPRWVTVGKELGNIRNWHLECAETLVLLGERHRDNQALGCT